MLLKCKARIGIHHTKVARFVRRAFLAGNGVRVRSLAQQWPGRRHDSTRPARGLKRWRAVCFRVYKSQPWNKLFFACPLQEVNTQTAQNHGTSKDSFWTSASPVWEQILWYLTWKRKWLKLFRTRIRKFQVSGTSSRHMWDHFGSCPVTFVLSVAWSWNSCLLVLGDYKRISDTTETFNCLGAEIGFGETGAITTLNVQGVKHACVLQIKFSKNIKFSKKYIYIVRDLTSLDGDSREYNFRSLDPCCLQRV